MKPFLCQPKIVSGLQESMDLLNEWEDKFSVGIPTIDEEHKKLIAILNNAIVAKEHNDNIEEIKDVLVFKHSKMQYTGGGGY